MQGFFAGAAISTAITQNFRGFNRHNPDTMGECSYDASTRTFTIAPKTGEDYFEFWVKGVRYVKSTAQSVVWTDTTGVYYFYFDDSGELKEIVNSSWSQTSFESVAICGCVSWNAESGSIVTQAKDEQHGTVMDSATHFRLHMGKGYTWITGGEISGLADGGSTYTGISQAHHMDEDISIVTLASTAHKWMYRSGTAGGWVKNSTADSKIAFMGTTYAQYNHWDGTTWDVTESTLSTDYIITYMIATHDSVDPYIKIVGQQTYSSRSAARKALRHELHTMQLQGLPASECEFQFAWIAKQDGTLEDDGYGNAYIDLRGTQINAVSDD